MGECFLFVCVLDCTVEIGWITVSNAPNTSHRISVSKADNTYKLATGFGADQESGTYHFGWGGSGDAKSDARLKGLWKKLEEHTGCTYDTTGEDSLV